MYSKPARVMAVPSAFTNNSGAGGLPRTAIQARRSVAFEREILGERVRAGLAHARQNGKRLGRPATAARHRTEIKKLHHAGVTKSEIARRLQIGRTSVRRIWKGKESST